MSDTQLIKDKIDIVDFIGEYVRLKSAGSRHKGLCPFHNEKTPSFMVSRDRGSWHCFGCGKGGDVFSFVQDMEGLSFVETLSLLADRTGVVLSKKASDMSTSSRNRLKECVAAAARFYHRFLLDMPAAQAARDYLDARGISTHTIEDWQIGFVPDQWDLLTQYLTKKGHSIDDLVAAGLTIKRDNASKQTGKGFYDRFRGRIMFPIRDAHGTVVGFTGRVLVETERSGGKYVNTPQTELYDKSRIVFGLDRAKKSIREKDQIVMVEGQTDVIAAHQAGMYSVVATSGTALTHTQITLLKRYSNNLSIAFDADVAGQAAAKRGLDLAIAAGMNVRIIVIPEEYGSDPDECIQKSPQAWQQAVKDAKDVMQWYLDSVTHGKDLSDPKQKQQVANMFLTEVARIPFAIEQDHWLRELAQMLHVDVSVLRQDMARVKAEPRDVQQIHQQDETREAKQVSRFDELVEQLLMLVLAYPSHADKSLFTVDEEISTTPHAPLYQQIKRAYTSGAEKLSQEQLVGLIKDGGENSAIDVLLLKADEVFSGIEDHQFQNECVALIKNIRSMWKKEQRKQITAKITSAEQSGNDAEVQRLLHIFQQMHNT
jgi:DNA primase